MSRGQCVDVRTRSFLTVDNLKRGKEVLRQLIPPARVYLDTSVLHRRARKRTPHHSKDSNQQTYYGFRHYNNHSLKTPRHRGCGYLTIFPMWFVVCYAKRHTEKVCGKGFGMLIRVYIQQRYNWYVLHAFSSTAQTRRVLVFPY